MITGVNESIGTVRDRSVVCNARKYRATVVVATIVAAAIASQNRCPIGGIPWHRDTIPMIIPAHRKIFDAIPNGDVLFSWDFLTKA
jgi:hypothetical protein